MAEKSLPAEAEPAESQVASQSKNRYVGLTVARRMVVDYMWAGASIARVGVTRRVALAEVMAVRRTLQNPPSLVAIFAKAFAIVALEFPALRQAYMRLPWPYIYEYADSTVCIMQERDILGDKGLLPLRFRTPDRMPLARLSRNISRSADEPIASSAYFTWVIRISRLPRLFRRIVWGIALNVPRLRRHSLGTYGVTSVARWQSELGTSLTPLPCFLSYGPTDDTGHAIARLSFDHRIFDGATAGRTLQRLDEVINGAILDELRALAASETDAPPAARLKA